MKSQHSSSMWPTKHAARIYNVIYSLHVYTMNWRNFLVVCPPSQQRSFGIWRAKDKQPGKNILRYTTISIDRVEIYICSLYTYICWV